MTNDDLEKMIAEAMRRYNAMTPKQQQTMWEEQRRSWVRGEMDLIEMDREHGQR